MAKKKKKYYIVIHGNKPGIYRQWYGSGGAAEQIEGFPDAIYKGFYTREEAIEWLRRFDRAKLANLAPDLLDLVASTPLPIQPESPGALLQAGKVLVYTDGGAIDNPGPGGYGVVMRFKGHKKETLRRLPLDDQQPHGAAGLHRGPEDPATQISPSSSSATPSTSSTA